VSAEYRLIVTGSREYSDRLALRAALDAVLDSLRTDVVLVVVHGGEEIPEYSRGADRIAGEWALEMEGVGLPVRQEAHPADWEGPCRDTCQPGHRQTWRGASMCPAAGPYRNTEMVQAGAHDGISAMKIGAANTGSKDCTVKMMAAGIPAQMLVQGKARGLPGQV
jgi:hypothetical protein